jgi:hypothetical protein
MWHPTKNSPKQSNNAYEAATRQNHGILSFQDMGLVDQQEDLKSSKNKQEDLKHGWLGMPWFKELEL